MTTSFNVKYIVEILFKQKKKIIIAFFATLGTVLIGTWLMTPVYEADSQFLVKFGREFAFQTQTGSQNTAYRPELTELMNGEIQILQSQDLAEKVVATITPQKLYPKMAEQFKGQDLQNAAVEKFKENLTIKGMEDSGVVQASF